MKQLEGEGLNPELLVLDVSSEQSVAAAKQTLQETHNRLDVLINNAAIFLSVRMRHCVGSDALCRFRAWITDFGSIPCFCRNGLIT